MMGLSDIKASLLRAKVQATQGGGRQIPAGQTLIFLIDDYLHVRLRGVFVWWQARVPWD